MGSERIWCLSLVVVIALLASSNACSMPEGWRPPTTVETITRADIVLYGIITNKYPDSRYTHDDVYTAEMEVYCSLKGQQVHKRTNITEAGFIAGHCTTTKLEVGKVYVVPLNSDFRPRGMSEINVTKMPEITQACNLNPIYPIDVDGQTAQVKCPVPTPPEACSLTKTADANADAVRVGASRKPKNGAERQARQEHSLTNTLTIITTVSLVMSLREYLTPTH